MIIYDRENSFNQLKKCIVAKHFLLIMELPMLITLAKKFNRCEFDFFRPGFKSDIDFLPTRQVF